MKNNHYDFVVKKISELKPYESNSRLHAQEQITQIMKSITTFGFTNPVLIDELGGVIAGHGRLEAATRLELSEVPCIVVTGLDQHKKAALVIADNKIAENATWNYDALKSELGFLSDFDFDLTLTGFNDDELDNLLEELSGDLNSLDMSDSRGVGMDYLVFGKNKVEISSEDFDELSLRLKQHIDSCGTTFGFVQRLIGNA
jgi:ParB family chromosome partitioning protein|tara:strand:- start:2704 stop:3306 length:603 start_codon:yes stop_codon:yes gene_type:complete